MINLIPASPARLQSWILRALREFPLKRSELLEHVNELAQKEGFTACNPTALKVALTRLQQLNCVVKPQHGWWGLPDWNKEFRQRRAHHPLEVPASVNGDSK